MRTFISIDIPFGSALKALHSDLQQNLKGVEMKLAETNQYHITFAFLGEIRPDQSNSIVADLTTIHLPSHHIELSLHGTGIFTHNSQPQVLWVGMEPEKGFMELYAQIQEVLSKHGFPQEKNHFSPHLTIARIRKVLPGNNLLALLEKYSNASFGKIMLTEFVLYQSILTQQKPIHRALKIFKF